MTKTRTLPDWIDSFEYEFDELSLSSAIVQTGEFAHEQTAVTLDIFAHGCARIRYDRKGDWQIESILINSHPVNWRSNAARPRVTLDPHSPLYLIVKASLIAEFDDAIERAAWQAASSIMQAAE